jgi:hypothetical protein
VGATAFLVTSLTLLSLYGFHRIRFGWLGRRGSAAAIVGTLLAGINNPIEHCGGVESMGFFVWVPSVLLWLLGSIAMGAAMLRAHLFPYVVVFVFIGGTLLGVVAFNSIGLIVYGFTWLVIGAAITFAHVDRFAEIQ